MYKVDFDSFFIQLQCPFLYHASVETYLTSYPGNSSTLTTVHWRKSSAFGLGVQVSIFMECRLSDGQNTLSFLNTENLLFSKLLLKNCMAEKCCIEFNSDGQPLSLSQSFQNLCPRSISQHCMSGARFQNPHNEKVSFTNLILFLSFKSINVKNCINYLIHEDLSY